MRRPSAAYTGEPDMPDQTPASMVPSALVIREPLRSKTRVSPSSLLRVSR
jgi:hypothetical protein